MSILVNCDSFTQLAPTQRTVESFVSLALKTEPKTARIFVSPSLAKLIHVVGNSGKSSYTLETIPGRVAKVNMALLGEKPGEIKVLISHDLKDNFAQILLEPLPEVVKTQPTGPSLTDLFDEISKRGRSPDPLRHPYTPYVGDPPYFLTNVGEGPNLWAVRLSGYPTRSSNNTAQ